MPSQFTQSLRIELQANGEDDTTWGDKTNVNFRDVLEAAIAGVATIVILDKDYTLSVGFAQPDEARNAVIVAQGSLTGPRSVIVPPYTKTYIVRNITSGGQTITVRTQGGSGVDVASGEVGIMYCDGANVVSAASVTKDGTLVPSKVSAAASNWRFNGAMSVNRGQTPDDNVGIYAIDGVLGSRFDMYANGTYIGFLSAGNGGVTLGGNNKPIFINQSGVNVVTIGLTGAVTCAGPLQANGIQSTGSLVSSGNAQVGGNFAVAGTSSFAGQATFVNATFGTITASVNVIYSSDERLKHKWLDIRKDFVEQLARVQAGSYALKAMGVRGMRFAGVTAQSMLPVLPEAVDQTEPQHLKLAYAQAALVSSVALARRVLELEARLNKLEAA